MYCFDAVIVIIASLLMRNCWFTSPLNLKFFKTPTLSMNCKPRSQQCLFHFMNEPTSVTHSLLFLKTQMLQKSKVHTLIQQEVITYCATGRGCIHGFLCLTLSSAAANRDLRRTLLHIHKHRLSHLKAPPKTMCHFSLEIYATSSSTSVMTCM